MALCVFIVLTGSKYPHLVNNFNFLFFFQIKIWPQRGMFSVFTIMSFSLCTYCYYLRSFVSLSVQNFSQLCLVTNTVRCIYFHIIQWDNLFPASPPPLFVAVYCFPLHLSNVSAFCNINILNKMSWRVVPVFISIGLVNTTAVFVCLLEVTKYHCSQCNYVCNTGMELIETSEEYCQVLWTQSVISGSLSPRHGASWSLRVEERPGRLLQIYWIISRG
jgi:hypothetical protein